MSAANSPMYAAGSADGAADALRIGSCPPLPPIGPQPPDPAYPVMYRRGYADEFVKAVPHICTDKCKQPA